ncbi:MAG: hypothetical protein V7K41_14740 [Nostoc sp.]|uniref:hypothetical protein n=1 Tax=Nostoc sp. TaxID=1180 RepID=UPI002FF9B10A
MPNTSITTQSANPIHQSIQGVVATPNPVESPSAWMQYGTSPTEIILATAIVIGAVATVIGAIAVLLQVLVPVMQSRSQHQQK